jgi:hypothetical protein
MKNDNKKNDNNGWLARISQPEEHEGLEAFRSLFLTS